MNVQDPSRLIADFAAYRALQLHSPDCRCAYHRSADYATVVALIDGGVKVRPRVVRAWLDSTEPRSTSSYCNTNMNRPAPRTNRVLLALAAAMALTLLTCGGA